MEKQEIIIIGLNRHSVVITANTVVLNAQRLIFGLFLMTMFEIYI